MDMMISPTKSPKVTVSKESRSGLLMSVIRTLSGSESTDQREWERAKLEREYEKCDHDLNELINLHNEDLKQVILLFEQMSTVITSTRDKFQNIREMLVACRISLSCRRDAFMKLWIEGLEHEHVLQLLEEKLE